MQSYMIPFYSVFKGYEYYVKAADLISKQVETEYFHDEAYYRYLLLFPEVKNSEEYRIAKELLECIPILKEITGIDHSDVAFLPLAQVYVKESMKKKLFTPLNLHLSKIIAKILPLKKKITKKKPAKLPLFECIQKILGCKEIQIEIEERYLYGSGDQKKFIMVSKGFVQYPEHLSKYGIPKTAKFVCIDLQESSFEFTYAYMMDTLITPVLAAVFPHIFSRKAKMVKKKFTSKECTELLSEIKKAILRELGAPLCLYLPVRRNLYKALSKYMSILPRSLTKNIWIDVTNVKVVTPTFYPIPKLDEKYIEPVKGAFGITAWNCLH